MPEMCPGPFYVGLFNHEGLEIDDPAYRRSSAIFESYVRGEIGNAERLRFFSPAPTRPQHITGVGLFDSIGRALYLGMLTHEVHVRPGDTVSFLPNSIRVTGLTDIVCEPDLSVIKETPRTTAWERVLADFED